MAQSLHGQRVLIVEDEPFIALDMEVTLSAAGAEVISTQHLGEAFEAAQHADISAAVLDVNMGDGDCGAVCEVLAKRQVPFIFHTGYVDGGPIDRWPRPVVAKPATQNALLDGLALALFGPRLSSAIS
jgi:CheY-like chemotaxis protein